MPRLFFFTTLTFPHHHLLISVFKFYARYALVALFSHSNTNINVTKIKKLFYNSTLSPGFSTKRVEKQEPLLSFSDGRG